MPPQRIDKVFAENLGIALGGGVRDQSVTLLNSDVPKLLGVTFCPIPFIGQQKKKTFRLLWAGALQGMALWAARDTLSSIQEEKLTRKVLFNLQNYADETLGKPLLRHVTPETIDQYNGIRRTFMRLAEDSQTTKDTFAKALWEVFHPQEPLEGARAIALANQMGLAMNVFGKIVAVMLEHPGSYTRATVEQKKKA